MGRKGERSANDCDKASQGPGPREASRHKKEKHGGGGKVERGKGGRGPNIFSDGPASEEKRG